MSIDSSRTHTQRMLATTFVFAECAQVLRNSQADEIRQEILQLCNELIQTRFLKETDYFTENGLKNSEIQSFFNRHFASRFPHGFNEKTKHKFAALIDDLLIISRDPEIVSQLELSQELLRPHHTPPLLEDIPETEASLICNSQCRSQHELLREFEQQQHSSPQCL